MRSLLWRVVIAVICVVILFALMPPLFHIFGIAMGEDVQTVLRICIGGIAILYVVAGPALPAPWGP
jgi:hypothetical protein